MIDKIKYLKTIIIFLIRKKKESANFKNKTTEEKQKTKYILIKKINIELFLSFLETIKPVQCEYFNNLFCTP